jgi:hypothetical protein
MTHKPTEVDLHAELGLEVVHAKYAALPPRLDVVQNAIVETARVFLGVRELGTSNSGYWIQRFLSAAGLSEGYPWCMGYVQWVFADVSGIWHLTDLIPRNTGSTQGAWKWAAELGLVHSDPEKVDKGDVPIWRNGLSAQGHTGIVTSAPYQSMGEMIRTIDGNTNGEYSRDGGQVAEHAWPVDRWGPWGDVAAKKQAKAGRRYVRGVISLEALMHQFWKAD